MAKHKNTICLWYDKDAEAAARFYAKTFPDSAVGAVILAPGDYPDGKTGNVLVVGGDLEGEGFAMFERRTAVEAETRDAGNCEFDRQHVALFAGWVVTGSMVDGTHRAVGKGLGVEAGSSLGVPVVPEADRVLCHCVSFRC